MKSKYKFLMITYVGTFLAMLMPLTAASAETICAMGYVTRVWVSANGFISGTGDDRAVLQTQVDGVGISGGMSKRVALFRDDGTVIQEEQRLLYNSFFTLIHDAQINRLPVRITSATGRCEEAIRRMRVTICSSEGDCRNN